MNNETVLQVFFADGTTKIIEYEGDDLAGITELLNKEKQEINGVHFRVVDEKGKVIFDRSFNYAPLEMTGE